MRTSKEPFGCPFCGSQSGVIEMGLTKNKFSVKCSVNDCGRGPVRKTKDDAIMAWNHNIWSL